MIYPKDNAAVVLIGGRSHYMNDDEIEKLSLQLQNYLNSKKDTKDT